jgi:hypothetical protein
VFNDARQAALDLILEGVKAPDACIGSLLDHQPHLVIVARQHHLDEIVVGEDSITIAIEITNEL